MPSLPDDALVVRGGINTVELLVIGSGVTIDATGKLYGVSVNSAPGKTVEELPLALSMPPVDKSIPIQLFTTRTNV